jgi:uncharacterized protein (TIGR03437 family)
MVFEPNHGQAGKQARWLARGPGYRLFLSEDEAVLALQGDEGKPSVAVRMSLRGSRRWRLSEGLEPTGGISNYFIGNDPKKWRTRIPHYRRVKFTGVYPGIDLLFYGSAGKLEYDLVVAPGADPAQVRLDYQGVKSIEVADNGDLVLITATGAQLRQQRPRVYQEIGGRKVEVVGVYEILDRRRVAIQVAFYDAGRPLIIDPALVYSTYLGGDGEDYGHAIAVDSAGAAYVTGSTTSRDFPTRSPYQTARGNSDVFVTKVTPAGNTLAYSTYLGGDNEDVGWGIAVDSAGSAYVTGQTRSTNFPTLSPFQPNLKGADDAFVTKLSPAGDVLVYSTYLGGGSLGTGAIDVGYGIAVDNTGAAYVTGDTSSTDFPTRSAFQPGWSGRYNHYVFVTKLSPTGNMLMYSTYLGGIGMDYGRGIAVDGTGAAYVTGWTWSNNFPLQSPIQTHPGDSYPNVFVTKFSPSGNALVYSTYLGGSGPDYARGIAVDGSGSAYVIGDTDSTNFPTHSPYQASLDGRDVFVAKLAPSGNALVYSTYLGGSGQDYGYGIAVDGAGSAYLTGQTDSSLRPFPTQPPLETRLRGTSDAFVTKLSPAGDALEYSAYLGGTGFEGGSGIAVDGAGAAYVTGSTGSNDFPTQSPFQTTQRESYVFPTGAFITKLEANQRTSGSPTITAVRNGASFETGIAPGAWVSIFGSDLAPATRTWRDDEIVAGYLPTELDGVRVLIGGKPAPVYYISPTQLNVQVPDGVAGASVPVQVTTPRGSTSTTVQVQQVAPGLFMFDARNRRYVAAQHGSDYSIVGERGLYPTSTPAAPGETIILYGTGFGPTTPTIPSGQVVSQAAPLAKEVVVFFGNKQADVRWAGLSGAGLYQVNVVVPDDWFDWEFGDVPVVVQIGRFGFGLPHTQEGAWVTVRK